MKKISVLILAIIMMLTVFAATTLPVSAANASLSFSSSTLRAGDTVSVTLNVTLSGALTVNGSFSYSSNLTLKSITASTGTLDTNGNNIFVDLGNSALSGNKKIVVAKFTVSKSVKEGDTISVSFSGNYSNLDGDYAVSGSKSTKVAAPLSTVNTLKSLTVSNATISPAFNTNTTKYTASVDYSVSKLNITATATDSKAKVSISGNSLKVGSNTVKITVTAESGAKKEYTITVTRAQDPNYVASNNAELKGITVSQGILSPAFDAEKTDYIVYLPYEVTTFSATGSVSDSKASAAATGDVALEVGENKATIVVTAEDGTKKEYNITVMRMQELGAEAPTATPTPEQTATEEPTPTPTETAPATTAPATTDDGAGQQAEQNNGMPIWIWILLLVVAFGLGLGVGMILRKKNA